MKSQEGLFVWQVQSSLTIIAILLVGSVSIIDGAPFRATDKKLETVHSLGHKPTAVAGKQSSSRLSDVQTSRRKRQEELQAAEWVDSSEEDGDIQDSTGIERKSALYMQDSSSSEEYVNPIRSSKYDKRQRILEEQIINDCIKEERDRQIAEYTEYSNGKRENPQESVTGEEQPDTEDHEDWHKKCAQEIDECLKMLLPAGTQGAKVDGKKQESQKSAQAQEKPTGVTAPAAEDCSKGTTSTPEQEQLQGQQETKNSSNNQTTAKKEKNVSTTTKSELTTTQATTTALPASSNCPNQEEWKQKSEEEAEACRKELKEREGACVGKQEGSEQAVSCEPKQDCFLQEEWTKKCQEEAEKCRNELKEKQGIVCTNTKQQQTTEQPTTVTSTSTNSCLLQAEWRKKAEKEAEKCREEQTGRDKVFSVLQQEPEKQGSTCSEQKKQECPLQEEWRKKSEEETEKCKTELKQKQATVCTTQEQTTQQPTTTAAVTSAHTSSCLLQAEWQEKAEKEAEKCRKEKTEREKLCSALQQQEPEKQVSTCSEQNKQECPLQEEWRKKSEEEAEKCRKEQKEREKQCAPKSQEASSVTDTKYCSLQEEWRMKCTQEAEKCLKEQKERERLCQEKVQNLTNNSTGQKPDCSADNLLGQNQEEWQMRDCNKEKDNCLKQQKEKEKLCAANKTPAKPEAESIDKALQAQRQKCEKENCNCFQDQKDKDLLCLDKQQKFQRNEQCNKMANHQDPPVPMPKRSGGNVSLPIQRNAGHRTNNQSAEQSAAVAWLASLDKEFAQACNEVMMANWEYATNVNSETAKRTVEAALESAKFQKDAWSRVRNEFNTSGGRFPTWKNYPDVSVKRRVKKHLTSIETAILPEEDLQKLETVQEKMKTIYATAKICEATQTKCNLQLEPEITEIMATSRNYDELAHTWKAWRDASGKKMRKSYIENVEYRNKAARLIGFKDAGGSWVAPYDTPNFKEEIGKLWEELKPWYKKIHAYMRRRLVDIYGEDRIDPTRPIPAHVLGNMWAQNWGNLARPTMPYPGFSVPDTTEALQNQNYTAQRMFKTAEEFFTSLGMDPMTKSFWKKSMLEKPTGREVVCHASAWDFCDGEDFRIKMCTEVNHENFVTVHHEMGHVQYFMEYRNQPSVFRDGANPGFHEAIGDTLALSFTTPKHLKTIGLLEKSHVDSVESDINYLHLMALEKIAFIPFAYLIDKWRWDLFSGAVPMSEMNSHWWKLREGIQGVRSPVPRSEEDFDPGAKYHVAANVPYVRYFVSNIIQFQFYEALCKAAGQYDSKDSSKPLHKCDFYRNEKAGKLFRDALKLGYSRPWPEVMKTFTGRGSMSASSLKTYFKPLEDWIDCYLAKSGDCIGWGDECKPENRKSPFYSSKRSAKVPLLPEKCKKFKIFK